MVEHSPKILESEGKKNTKTCPYVLHVPKTHAIFTGVSKVALVVVTHTTYGAQGNDATA